MAIVSRLGVVLGLDSAQFNSGLGLAETKLGAFAKSTVGSRIGVAALGTALVGAAIQAISYADSINDTAKANEVAVGTVLKLSEALSISGGNSENTGKLLSSLTNKIDEAANGSDKGREAFAKLGISVGDLRRLDETQLFEKALKGLNEIQDPITRNALAMDVFGKAAKNVDMKGVADSYFNNAGKFDDAEKAFKDIGDAIDKMDIFTKRASTSLATNLAPALSNSVTFLNAAIFGWDNLTEAVKRYNIAKNGGVMWTPKNAPRMDDKPQMGLLNLPAEFQAGGRGQDISDKDQAKIDKANEKKIADAKKLADEIKKQKDALQDQIQSYDAQSYAAGRTLTEVEKVTLELEQGKKYKYTTAEQQADLLMAARRLDYNNAYADAAKRAAEYELQKYEMAKQANDLVYNSEVATERLNLERQLAGQSDTQVQLALEYFDLQKKIIAMQKDGNAEQDIANFANAEMNRIKAQELNERAQKTFQAGWDKAYNNFVERAQDSAALGAEAFSSMANSMTSAIDKFVQTGKFSFSDFTGSIIRDLISIQLKAQATGIFSSLFGGMFGGGDGMGFGLTSSSTNIANGGGLMGLLGFADGGSPPVNQPSIVGERGAELFVPRTAGTIIPNNSLSAMMGGQPQTVYNGTVIQNMNAIDTQSGVQFISKNKNAIFAANQSAQRSLPQSR
jgi:lambda family phage tail tape measure protein